PRLLPLCLFHSFPTRRSSDLEVITTKAYDALNDNADHFVIRLVKVEVKPEDAEKFAHEVKKEMTTSMAAEPGMEIMMSGVNKKKDRKSTRLNSSHVSISYAVF